MPADIFERDSQVGLEEAWHGLTKVVPEITEENAEILYPMEMRPLYLKKDKSEDHKPIDHLDNLPNFIKTDHFVVVSLDDGLPIGKPVSSRYELISNKDIWRAVEYALYGTEHTITSVGTVCNREKGFISIKLSSDFIAAKRKTSSVLNVMWGHGGIMNLTAKTGFTVIVCHNTYKWAMSERGDFNFKVKHVGDSDLKLENMQNAIEAHLGIENTFREAMNEFNETLVSAKEAKEFFAGFICDNGLVKPSTRSQNQYTFLNNLFYSSPGNDGNDASDVFNAITDYYTHYSAGGEENVRKQFESSEFGMSADRKTEAFKVLYGAKVPRIGTFEDCVERGEMVLDRAAG